ncbi:MAG: UDP-N-acetylmuramoyl-L-alanine--D-glutamate ligase [Victivallales bacterium]|jgi:UDP-N-acetylmuramoylalanine--D-glutamate ligase|nr:UDP-N-acetylmuramoyl-L-alanine--D-glutamate ligase [Victivallales bacterium]
MPHCVILGGGVSGKAAERLACSLGFSTEILSDHPDLDAPSAIANADLLVCSPGVKPLSSPLWQAAVKRVKSGEPCEFISELEFGFRHWPGKVLAITGTNGKTTTTELTVALLQAVGIDARPAGNIGYPLSDLVADLREGKLSADVLPIIEVSSFQLELSNTFAPYAAVLLNIKSDHVDRYAGGFDEYATVKKRIFDRVDSANQIYGLSINSPVPRRVTVHENMMILDADFPLVDLGLPLKTGNLVKNRISQLYARPYSYLVNFMLARYLQNRSSKMRICRFLASSQFLEIPLGNTALTAPHNRENLAAALELCSRVLPSTTIRSQKFQNAITSFRPGRHRQELILSKDNIRYVNDSKATNPAATIAALQATPGKVVLLLGGLDKGMDFSAIGEFAGQIRFVALYGECRKKIAEALPSTIPVADCGMDFERAIRTACDHAQTGDTVLLAPACASMDMFKDYQERGERFAQYITNGYL